MKNGIGSLLEVGARIEKRHPGALERGRRCLPGCPRTLAEELHEDVLGAVYTATCDHFGLALLEPSFTARDGQTLPGMDAFLTRAREILGPAPKTLVAEVERFCRDVYGVELEDARAVA